MDFIVSLDNERISTLLERKLVEEISERYSEFSSDVRYSIRKGIEKAITEYVYAEKENIIEKVI